MLQEKAAVLPVKVAIGGIVSEIVSLPAAKAPSHRRQFSPLAAQITKQLQIKKELFGDPLLTVSEVSAALGSPSYSSLRSWIKSGALKTIRFTPRAHHRIRLSELRRFMAAGVQDGQS